MADLKTFKDILDLTKNRIGELDNDSQIDLILKNAINFCYQNELSKDDKRITTSYLPIINGVATLPDDLDTIENIVPALSGEDRRVGNAIITTKEGTFTLTYSYLREPLINDTDTPDMSSKYFYLLSTYACYTYYKFKKKTQLEQSYFNEYMTAKEMLKGTDRVQYTVGNIFSSFGLGDEY